MSRACPVCASRRGETLHRQDFILPEGHPLEGGYDVLCCERCGFVFADTTVGQAEYDEYYARHSKYEDATTGTGGGEKPWDLERLRDMAADLGEVLDPKASVLDVGCANGGLLAALRERGFSRLVGLDPSPACVATTRSIAGVRAEEGSLFALPEGLGRFDCLVLSHVLEHVHDLREAIACLRVVLDPGGRLYVEVPDAMRYASNVVAPFQDFNTEHVNHFSLTSLDNLFEPHGFHRVGEGTKTLLAPPPSPYPAVFAFYALEENAGGDLVRDAALREAIGDYIERSARMLAAMDERLRGVLGRTDEVIVWGTGQLAMKLLHETALRDAPIAAFVDSNPLNHGQRLRGVPIVGPDAVRSYRQPIVITSTIHEDAIAETIRGELGMTNEVVSLRV